MLSADRDTVEALRREGVPKHTVATTGHVRHVEPLEQGNLTTAHKRRVRTGHRCNEGRCMGRDGRWWRRWRWWWGLAARKNQQLCNSHHTPRGCLSQSCPMWAGIQRRPLGLTGLCPCPPTRGRTRGFRFPQDLGDGGQGKRTHRLQLGRGKNYCNGETGLELACARVSVCVCGGGGGSGACDRGPVHGILVAMGAMVFPKISHLNATFLADRCEFECARVCR
jgi:hypothetical protein